MVFFTRHREVDVRTTESHLYKRAAPTRYTAGRKMHYQILRPTGPLRRYVKALWSLEQQLPSGERDVERIAPNGCAFNACPAFSDYYTFE